MAVAHPSLPTHPPLSLTLDPKPSTLEWVSADSIVSLEGSGRLMDVLSRGGWEQGGHWYHQTLGIGGIAAAERALAWRSGRCGNVGSAREVDPGGRTASGFSPSDRSWLNHAQHAPGVH